jgi:hypothetical protein
VHCDPCEAAVDEPLLYEQWGKNVVRCCFPACLLMRV